MIAEVISRSYDSVGKPVSQPSKKRHRFFRPTFPMGAYVSQPLLTKCKDFDELRRFLAQCRYVSDQAQFGKKDYWMTPEEFEKRKKGDCDDFALWTWRQLLAMGYDARFVVGHSGRYGSGHAWVTFTENGRTFLVEPLAAWLVPKLPRLSTMRYQPGISVAWDGKRLRYYEHEKKTYDPSVREVITLLKEWIPWWLTSRSKAYYRLGRYLTMRVVKAIRTHQQKDSRPNS
jgi:hypothetical protein